MRKLFDKYSFLFLCLCLVLLLFSAGTELFWDLWFALGVYLVILLWFTNTAPPSAKKLSYKDAALCYPDMGEARKNIVKAKAESEQAMESTPSSYYAAGDSIYDFVKNGDPEFDAIPVDELMQQHASEMGKTLETEDEYLMWALRMLKTGQKSIYEFHDRKVNSILRRTLGIPTSIVEFKKGLPLKDPFVTYAWNDRLNSCGKIYTVKFYRRDNRPAKSVPMEEYEYMDDKNAAKEHFERFRHDRSLLYSHIELTEVSAKSAEKILQTIIF